MSRTMHQALSPVGRRRTCLVFLLAICVALSTACNGGVRPTLVADAPPTPQPRLELNLPAAPAGTQPLEPATNSLPAESSVDDALAAWANQQNVAYTDGCSRSTPAAGELCDVATERDTVRLLGPSATEIWYVATIEESTSFDTGTGYRVVSVDLAQDY